jgi:hypothetical protein
MASPTHLITAEDALTKYSMNPSGHMEYDTLAPV